MASPETLIKAAAAQEAILRLSGVKPEMDVQQAYVRLFYPESKKAPARTGWEEFFKSDTTSDVRFDIAGEVAPGLLKRYGVYLVGGIAALLALIGLKK